jgi:RNA polymerase sigma factor for flagellar operon FliA
VGRLTIKTPRSLEEEDLLSYGMLGLIEAIDRFDPSRGVKFQTFAASRIRGQVIDSLRMLDLLPRSARRHVKQIEEAIAQLCQSLGRVPEDSEIAEHLDISLTQYHDRLRETSWSMISLDQPITSENGEQFTLYDSLEDATVQAPTERLDQNELKSQLVSAILALPERERLMISLYYNEGLTMKEIGQVLDVSESRVSQIHTRTILTLRALMRKNSEAKNMTYGRNGIHAPVYANSH